MSELNELDKIINLNGISDDSESVGSEDESVDELDNKKICDKCLDPFKAHKCFRCGVEYCGCDSGSYYMTAGPSEYTCTPCFDRHEQRLKKSVGYRICHNMPLWIGGIIVITINGWFYAWLLFIGIKTLFETYSLIEILFWGSILSFVIYKFGLFLHADHKRCKKNHEKFMKQRLNESDAKYRHRINHYRWNREIWDSGI